MGKEEGEWGREREGGKGWEAKSKGRERGEKGGREGEDMKKKSDSVQGVARVIKVQSNAGGRREQEEENQREKEEERSKNRKRGPEERGREGEWEDNCLIHQQGKA